MNDSSLRPAIASDLAAIKALVEAAYRPWVEVIGAVPGPLLADYAVPLAKQRITLAEAAGALLGLMVLDPQPNFLRVDNIAIAPHAQGQGLGRRFVALAEETAIANGFDQLELYTNAKMTSNIQLYERLGFRRAYTSHTNGLDRVHMTKDLGQRDP